MLKDNVNDDVVYWLVKLPHFFKPNNFTISYTCILTWLIPPVANKKKTKKKQ